jgi:hypothetical protein
VSKLIVPLLEFLTKVKLEAEKHRRELWPHKA